MILTDLLRRAAVRSDDSIAVEMVDGERITYGQLLDRSLRLASGFERYGLTRGDRIGLLGRGSSELIVSYHAAVAAGIIAVPIDPRLTPNEIRLILEDAEPSVVFAEPDVLSRCEGAIRLATTTPPIIPLDSRDPDFTALTDGRAGIERAREEDTALMLYTSGTTGRPKGVCLSHRALIWNALTIACAQRLRSDDAYLAVSPMSHAGSGTRAFTMLADSQRLVVARSFDVERFPSILREHRPTTTILVPTMMEQLLERWPDEDLGQLRSIVYGAAPSAETTVAEARARWKSELYHAYGLTEACTNVAILPPELFDDSTAGSVGWELPGVRIEIRGEDGGPAPVGEIGEVFIRSDKVMSGYWRQPEETAAVLKDGWLRTGDLGRRDRRGMLWLVGRSKDLVICGGNNVYPAEIENVLAAHPDVREVAVVGAPHKTMGEVPVAFVDTGGATVDAADIVAFAAERLSRYKQPRTVHFVDALPHTSSGKVAKHELRRQLQEGD